MVSIILKLFHKEFHNVNEAAILIGLFTLLSQILGLFRDRLFAGTLGTTINLDIYYTAFKIPDLLFAMVASVVSVTILIPFFVKKLHRNGDGEEEARIFINRIFSAFSLFMILICIATWFLLPSLMPYIAPGFSANAQETTVWLSRIMLLSPLLLGLSNLFGTITQTFKKFFVYAISPVFYNVGLIFGIWVLYPHYGMMGLAYGVGLAAFIHMAVQIPVVIKQGMLPKITLNIDWQEIWDIVKTAMPRTFALSLSSLVFIILIAFASTMGEGTISVLNLARNLQNVPLSLIGASFSAAAFPVLVEFLSARKVEEFVVHIINPMKQIIFWSVPVIVGFIVLRAQIVRVILGTGEFGWDETRLVAASLAVFVISVAAQSLVLLLVRGFYAAGETRKPLYANFITSIASVLLSLGLVYVFHEFDFVRYFFESVLRIGDVPGSDVIMLALGYSIGAILNFVTLWILFRRDFPYTATMQKGLEKTMFQSFGASIIMGAVIYAGLFLFSFVFDQNTFIGIFLQGLISGLLGIFAWVGILVLLRSEELIAIWRALHKRFWKDKIAGVDQIV